MLVQITCGAPHVRAGPYRMARGFQIVDPEFPKPTDEHRFDVAA